MEYYGVSTPSSDFFMHYGVKGMKWGVRRYQNADGSLTKAGLRKIARHNSGYLNPSRKDIKRKKNIEREKVASDYEKEYTKQLTPDNIKNGGFEKLNKLHLTSKYKTGYASAVLKDAKLKDTPKARKAVKNYFRYTDSFYNGKKHPSTGNYDADLAAWEKSERMYLNRRKSIAHPVLYKIHNRKHKG